MKFNSVSSLKNPGQYDCLVFSAFGSKLGSTAAKIDVSLATELKQKLTNLSLSDEAQGYEIFASTTFGNKPLIALIQFSDHEILTIKIIQKQMTAIIKYVSKLDCKSLLFCLSESKPKQINSNQYYQLLAQYCEMTEYQLSHRDKISVCPNALEYIVFFDPQFKKNKLKLQKHKQQKIRVKSTANQFIDYGRAIGQGINFCKSISNLPANLCTPPFLAQQALELDRNSAIQTTVIDEAEMKKLNMNCILAVSKGSNQPAKLIILKHKGAGDDCQPVVLIGKGVTFDSGGYSIKSAPGMHEMKFDMCGAASVMSTMQVISQLNLSLNVVALIPCSENLINGRAFKPGDVLASMSGQTVEILSTDAEGRLLLADALTYSQRFNPSLVIDVATLTGAAITALGYDISAIMSNNEKLSNKLCHAARMSHDYLWPLPVWEDYSEALNSNFADMASSAGRSGNSGAGASVAACFLAKFVNDNRWAHLDVAGTAWHRDKHLSASGRPVALLSQFLINYSNKPF